MENTIGTIPEFTSDETVPAQVETPQPHIPEEVNPTDLVAETDTPALPAEKPEPVVEPLQDETQKAIQGLQAERVKLLKEVSELKGQKREIKQEQINTVQAQIDELKDINPEDQAIMEKFLRAKGMVSKDEVNKMFYEAVKTEEVNRFLEKYPEYKPENDPEDVNWQTLQREIAFYRTPENPRQIAELLERAHRGVVKVPSVTNLAPQRRQIALASVGRGGTQTTPTISKLDPEKRAMLKGFSDEEIQQMEQKL